MFKKLFGIALAILLLSGCGASSSNAAPDLSSAVSSVSSSTVDGQQAAQPQEMEGIVEKAEETALCLRADDGELLTFTVTDPQGLPELAGLLGGETVRVSYLAKAEGENDLVSLKVLAVPDRAEEALQTLLSSMTLEEKVAQMFWSAARNSRPPKPFPAGRSAAISCLDGILPIRPPSSCAKR